MVGLCGFPCPASQVNTGAAAAKSPGSSQEFCLWASVEPFRNRSVHVGSSPGKEQQQSPSSPTVYQAPPHCQTLPKLLLCKGISQETLLSRWVAQLPQPGGLCTRVTSLQPPFPQAWGPGVTPQAHTAILRGGMHCFCQRMPFSVQKKSCGKEQQMVCPLHDEGMGKTDPKLG